MYTILRNRYDLVGFTLGSRLAETREYAEAESLALATAKGMGHKNPRVIEGTISVPGDFYLEIVEGGLDKTASA